MVLTGPVKGDEQLWFYDELDVQPYLKAGVNHFLVRVLRFYHASSRAMSFPRLPYAGLLISTKNLLSQLRTDDSWTTAIDKSVKLPTNNREDDFLHVYEEVDGRKNADLEWIPAKIVEFHNSHGQSSPWKLVPRKIPPMVVETKKFFMVHNARSTVSESDWMALVTAPVGHSIRLSPGSKHHIELEVEYHLTARLQLRLQRPESSGSMIKITYSECYEDEPVSAPYLRSKSNRRDTSKHLYGPTDRYIFSGKEHMSSFLTQMQEHGPDLETFSPFHFRTFRFLALDILVDARSDLVVDGIDIFATNYPLEVVATFDGKANGDRMDYPQILDTSIRTLRNCMHDSYEDCPFYEQLQYAMDTRSSALFTYSVSGDDRLARQAMCQLHNSYSTHSNLTASRAPCHVRQEIPNFSLFWICMVADHFQYFADASFARQFVSVIDGVLEHFAQRMDESLGLVKGVGSETAQWDFVDWSEAWRPLGIPPSAVHSGFQTFTNMLYVYTLQLAANLLEQIGRPGNSREYQNRAAQVVRAIRTHCFDGDFFTDGLASVKGQHGGLSQTVQIWAVLSGAATGSTAERILRQSLSDMCIVPCSTAMAFYMLRALAQVGGTMYNEIFHRFWDPWRAQLGQELTSWVEDDVSNRSDCHAWGCSPLYDFAHEVAGLSPALPGWAAMNFRPRVDLFDSFEASIPVRAKGACVIAKVAWSRLDEIAQVSLRFDTENRESKFRVRLSTLEEKVLHGGESLSFALPCGV